MVCLYIEKKVLAIIRHSLISIFHSYYEDELGACYLFIGYFFEDLSLVVDEDDVLICQQKVNFEDIVIGRVKNLFVFNIGID